MKLGTLVRIKDIANTEAQFKELHDLGFEACQLVYKADAFCKEDAEIIKNAAQKYNVDISAQFCGYHDKESVWNIYYGYLVSGINIEAYKAERIQYIKQQIDFASWLGTQDVIIHAGFVPNNPFSSEYISMCQAVTSLAKYCKERNMNLLFETGCEAPIVLVRLIEDVGMDNLYINFDPANIFMYGLGNASDALRVFGKYVRNCHGKDGNLPTDPKKIGAETPLGEGMVNYPEIIKMFKELHYDRYIIIEREIKGDQQKKDILKAKKYLEELLAQ